VTWGAWIEPRRLVVRDVELQLPHWPPRLDGLRAGVLSDLHSGVPHVGFYAIADYFAEEAQGLDFIEAFTETKTTWHPIGV